jgi:hypothetical protein
MDLTNEQLQAIRGGEPVPVALPEVGEECVVVRRDVYERMTHAEDDDLPSPAAIGRIVEAIAGDDDDLDSYQQYKR